MLDIKYTDALKGIAILLIMLQHLGASEGTRLLTPLGGIGVAIFLLFSGFGLNESFKKSGFSHFWSKKIVRVFIPYFIVETICFCIFRHVSWEKYLLDIFGIDTYCWYVGFLLKQYIAFYILTRFFYKWRMYLWMLFSLVILIYFPKIEAEQAFSFYAGILISQHTDKIEEWMRKNYRSIYLLTLIVGITLLGLKQTSFIRAYESYWIYNVVECGIKFSLGLFLIISLHKLSWIRKNPFFLFTGMISYELYLVHFWLLSLLDRSLVNTLLFIALSFGIATLFFHINKRMSKCVLRLINS